MKSKILELFGEPIGHGGQEAYVMNHLKRMDKSAFCIDFLTPYSVQNKTFVETVNSWGGRVYSLNLEFLPGRSREYIAAALREFFKDHYYDIVHIHSGSSSVYPIGAKAAKLGGCKSVIVHAHIAPSVMTVKSKIIRKISNLRMSKYVDVFCACSKAAAAAKFTNKNEKNTIILHNGISTSEFRFSTDNRAAIRKAAGVSDSDRVIGNVGRLAEQKNQLYLLEILRELLDRGKRYKLWLVGDGPDRDLLVSAADALDISEHVSFWGTREDIGRLLSGMDVFCFPSRFEGFGIAPLEAEANGLPCIISSCIPRDVILPGCTMYTLPIDRESISEWADCVLRIDHGHSTDGENKVFEAGYDISNTVQDLKRVYSSLVGSQEI